MDQSKIPDAVFERMVAVRRDLHQHPELSWEESRTADRIAHALDGLGIAYRRVAKTGLIADLPGDEGLPMVALRADTDALPIHERTDLPFASVNAGVMHACGHDGHTSMLLGAAEVLRDRPRRVPIRLLWQPAEEHGTGALAMIEAGALEGVELIFGGHLDAGYPEGTLIVTDGPVNASTDEVQIVIEGRAGHGARPHQCVDAIVVGAAVVQALQNVVAREIDPARAAVITIGTFQAGAAPNVIAGRAELTGTIRSQHPDVRAQLCEAVPRIARAVGEAHRATVVATILPGTPPLLNEPGPTALAREAAIQVVGAERVVPLRTANMGGEDFAWYLQHRPGAYIRYGAEVKGREGVSAHSSRWDFHERTLAHGAAWLVAVAERASARILEEHG